MHKKSTKDEHRRLHKYTICYCSKQHYWKRVADHSLAVHRVELHAAKLEEKRVQVVKDAIGRHKKIDSAVCEMDLKQQAFLLVYVLLGTLSVLNLCTTIACAQEGASSSGHAAAVRAL